MSAPHQPQARVACGLDFGTSNSAVAVYGRSGTLVTHSEPSLLYFPEPEGGRQEMFVGEQARGQYVAHGLSGRYIRGIKTLLPNASFESTDVYGRRYRVENMITAILRHLKQHADAAAGGDVELVVLGRPVVFSLDRGNDELAEQRLVRAARAAGFALVHVLPEPIAAAYASASAEASASASAAASSESFTAGSIVLVADFGGGTCDYCVIRLSGEPHQASFDRDRDVLATGGVRVGGTDFDARIMWERIVDHFGRGTTFESWGKQLEIPLHLFRSICRWENISTLKRPKEREDLRFVRSGALDQTAVGRLERLIDQDLGLALLTEVERAKCQLSEVDQAEVRFDEADIGLRQTIGERELRDIIAEQVQQIVTTLDETIADAGLSGGDIDVCFLTGGSSLVRSLREYFEGRFGPEAVRRGDAFNSVVRGLLQHAVQLV